MEAQPVDHEEQEVDIERAREEDADGEEVRMDMPAVPIELGRMVSPELRSASPHAQ